jgi:hypothetical protein
MQQDTMQVKSPPAVNTTSPLHRRTPTPSQTLRTVGTGLLNQQIWCWGQDIRSPTGNLLLSYGFTRTRPPGAEPGSSHYCLRLSERANISLWGFGMFYGHAEFGGLFLQRYAFTLAWTPQAALPAHVWTPEQLPSVAAPRTVVARLHAYRLLFAAVRWIVQYEKWIRDTVGLDYRHQCIARFSASTVPADEMIGAWRGIAQAYQHRARRLRRFHHAQQRKEAIPPVTPKLFRHRQTPLVHNNMFANSTRACFLP